MKLTEEQIQELREILDRCIQLGERKRIYISDSKHFNPGEFYYDCIWLYFEVGKFDYVRIDDYDLNDGDVHLTKKERKKLLRTDKIVEIYHPRTYDETQLKELHQIFISLKQALDRKQDVGDALFIDPDCHLINGMFTPFSNFSETSAIGKAGHTDGTFYYAHDRFFWLAGDKKYIIDGYYKRGWNWNGKIGNKISYRFGYGWSYPPKWDDLNYVLVTQYMYQKKKIVMKDTKTYYIYNTYIKERDPKVEYHADPPGEGEF